MGGRARPWCPASRPRPRGQELHGFLARAPRHRAVLRARRCWRPSSDLPDLRFLLVAGEACPKELVRRWHRPGPAVPRTSTARPRPTVAATWTELQPDRPVTLGVPLPTYGTVDPGRRRPAPGAAARPDRRDRHRRHRAGLRLPQPRRPHRAGLRRGLPGHPGEPVGPDLPHRRPGPGQHRRRDRVPRPDRSARTAGPRATGRTSRDRSSPGRPAPRRRRETVRGGPRPRRPVARRRPTSWTPPRRARTAPPGPGDGAVERDLAAVLAEVVGAESVSVEGHFFDDLGADSMVMARFCARVRKRADLPSVSMKDVYPHPSIRSLAVAFAPAAPRRVRPAPVAPAPPPVAPRGRRLRRLRLAVTPGADGAWPRCWPRCWASSRCRSTATSSTTWARTRW